MLDWNLLLNDIRRKEIGKPGDRLNTSSKRLEIERDYDRLLFAAPTRRLADKTQVFPMEVNDSVRNRLTHSHEVSNLARSIGTRLAYDHHEELFDSSFDQKTIQRTVPSLLAAVGLAHDLGNPPFGHQGEAAMGAWFKKHFETEAVEEINDFTEFDGNAQTFRLVTKLQILNDNYGLNLTVATLASLLKYPSIYGREKHGRKKHGIFAAEGGIASEVWEHTGLAQGIRHPLAYVMEACDDIAYSVIDAEDTVKKGYASYRDVIDYLNSHANGDDVVERTIKRSERKHEEFRREDLSIRELNDLSMQIFRVVAISEMGLS